MPSAPDHHRARRLALQGLCCLDVLGPDSLPLFSIFLRESRETLETLAEADAMLRGALAERLNADRLLQGESQHWNLIRMAMVDRNILRLALWEIMSRHAPKRVVIAEALLLANEFASVDSPRFINGVLDAAAKRLESGGDQ